MIRPISVGAEGTVMTVIAVLARAHVRQHRQSGRIPPPNAGRPDAVTDQPPVTISCQGTPSTRTAAPRGRRSNRCENNGKGFPAGDYSAPAARGGEVDVPMGPPGTAPIHERIGLGLIRAWPLP